MSKQGTIANIWALPKIPNGQKLIAIAIAYGASGFETLLGLSNGSFCDASSDLRREISNELELHEGRWTFTAKEMSSAILQRLEATGDTSSNDSRHNYYSARRIGRLLHGAFAFQLAKSYKMRPPRILNGAIIYQFEGKRKTPRPSICQEEKAKIHLE